MKTRVTELTLPLKAVAGLNLLQAAARLWFVYVIQSGGIGEFLEVPLGSGTLTAISAMFLRLGVAGIVSVVGFVRKKEWGLTAVLAVNGLTVLFDVWGYTVQSSALLGLLVPGLTALLVLRERGKLKAST